MKAAFLASALASAAPLQACSQCRPLVGAAIQSSGFAQNLALMLLPLLCLLAIAGALYFSDSLGQKIRSWRTATNSQNTPNASSAGR
jgi:hypothetical protein